MTPRRWIALVVGVLALAAGLALSGDIYTAVPAGGKVYRLNRWTGSLDLCGPRSGLFRCVEEWGDL